MTLTKESLRSALEAWDHQVAAGELVRFANVEFITAARFVERLLPEKCPCGINEGFLDPCPRCQDTGQLWDEGLVEAVTNAMFSFDWTEPHGVRGRYAAMARAVLVALAQEVGK